jgi:regulator of replication initiation timing
MNINKAHWVTEGDNVRLSMPIGKIDVERRTVSGFATLDNVDKQDDIITTEASLNAFKSFRGNLREMHQPSAVGRIVSFKEDRYFDPTSKKFYSGVYVSAYVSKGAQDAWEKVLDGTYSGFSIGGNIKDYDEEYDENVSKSIRVVKDYELHELSLVDNPANQFANIVSIEKINGENHIDGYLAKTEIENVYWCNSDDVVNLSENKDASCPSCNGSMQNIGFVEKNDTESADTIKFLVDSAKGINTIKMDKEVSPMTEATETTVEKSEEVVEEVEVAPEADATDSDLEKSEAAKAKTAEDEKMEEEEEDEDEYKGYPDKDKKAKKSDSSEEVSKSEDVAVTAAVSDIKETLTSAFSDLAETVKSLHQQVSELSKSLESVSKEVTEAKEEFNEFGKRVDQVEADTAFRKSGDLGEIVQESERIQKSLWGGRFLTNADLFN